MKQEVISKMLEDEFFHNEENFISKTMLSIMEGIEEVREGEVIKAIYKVAVGVDEAKIKQWLERAKLMDEIDQSLLIDIAVKKMILRLQQKNKELQEQLEEKNEKIAEMQEKWNDLFGSDYV